MILRMDYYTLKCDNCGEVFADEYSGFSAWNDESGAMEYASNEDWIEDDGNHYCPKCYGYDDDDNLILKQVPKSDTPCNER